MIHLRTPSLLSRSFSRRSSTSSCISSAAVSLTSLDDGDAITPVDSPSDMEADTDSDREGCCVDTDSDSDCYHDSDHDSMMSSQAAILPFASDDYLWHRMLAIQRRFHCYNSARMRAALDSELVEAVVPPRTCLLLLHDSVASQLVSEEARREIAALAVLMGGQKQQVQPETRSMPTTTAAVAMSVAARVKARSKARQQRRRVWRQKYGV